MINTLIIILASILLSILLYCESREGSRALLPIKTALSSLFIIAALVQPHPISLYYHFVLLALLFCLAGDIFLALPQKNMFLCGLISFLAGHIFYIFGFGYLARPGPWTWAGVLVIFAISGLVYIWLKPHLGKMKLHVLIYVIVISIMLSGAWSLLCDSPLALHGRIMIFAGALSFYISDVFVARDRFLKKDFLNRLIGLPVYYAGQFLLALSVGSLTN
jgi:uncharacterized membrane protein YhhN